MQPHNTMDGLHEKTAQTQRERVLGGAGASMEDRSPWKLQAGAQAGVDSLPLELFFQRMKDRAQRPANGETDQKADEVQDQMDSQATHRDRLNQHRLRHYRNFLDVLDAAQLEVQTFSGKSSRIVHGGRNESRFLLATFIKEFEEAERAQAATALREVRAGKRDDTDLAKRGQGSPKKAMKVILSQRRDGVRQQGSHR